MDITDSVEVKALYDIPSLKKYENWATVSSFLACGLQGVEIRNKILTKL